MAVMFRLQTGIGGEGRGIFTCGLERGNSRYRSHAYFAGGGDSGEIAQLALIQRGNEKFRA